VQVQQNVVGGEQLQPCAGRLRDDEAVERVMSCELGEVADALGMFGGDAKQFQALAGEPSAEVRRDCQLAEHGLNSQFPYRRSRDVYALR
jgi:hypothetical protein